MDGNSFIKEIGRSYIVSSVFPAAFFILLGTLLFQGFVPLSISQRLDETSSLFGFRWMIVLTIVLWVAFALFSSVDWIVKLFEGYLFPAFVRKLLIGSLRKRWFLQLAPAYTKLTSMQKKETLSENQKKRFVKLRPKALAELQDLELRSPLDKEQLLPTRLGNVLRASELYAYERYKLESLSMWPRLFHVLPIRFVRNLEEKNNHLLFMLNSALLALILGGICIILGLIRLPCQIQSYLGDCDLSPDIQSFFIRGYSAVTPFEYLLIGIAIIGFGYFLYRIAVNAAIDYGLFVRSGFDLYRFNLLTALHQELPRTLYDEEIIWPILTEFMIAANRLGRDKIELNYRNGETTPCVDAADTEGQQTEP